MRRLALVLLPIAFAACSNGTTGTGTSTPTATPPTISPSGPEHIRLADIDVIVRGRRTVTGGTVAVAIKDNYFEPNVLVRRAGTTVTFTLTNRGTLLHNFSVNGRSISRDLRPGASASIPVKIGSDVVVFFCKYHRDESGMLGEIGPV